MADLAGRSIASSYKELLKTESLTGVTSGLTVVEDGDGTTSALQISSSAVRSAGTLEAAGATTLLSTLSVAGASTLTGAVNMAGNLTVQGNALIQGTLTTNGGTLTLGGSGSDSIVFNADVDSHILPNVDNAYDLGSPSKEWKDIYIDGTANVDSLVADAADINGGSIDGITIGTNAVATDLRVDNLRLDGNTIFSTDTNGNIVLSPEGTGSVSITKGLSVQGALTVSGLTIPASGTLATLSGAETLTNKTLTSPTMTSPTLGAASATSLALTNPLAISSGGTGASSAANALNALAPSQAGNAGRFLTTDGSSITWGSPTAAASSISVDTTDVIGASAGAILINNNGKLGTLTSTTGTGSVVLSSSPTLVTPILSGTASGTAAGALGYSSGTFSYGNGAVQRVVVNTNESQTLTNKTLTAPTISNGSIDLNSGTLIIPRSAAPTLTSIGSIAWDTTNSLLVVKGNGVDKTMVDTDSTQTLSNKTLSSPTLTSPTLTAPNLGAATASSINKVSITSPASGATLTVADSKTLTANNSLTLSGTDGSTVNFGAGGAVAYTDKQQSYTRTHNFTATTLSDAATISWDLSQNQVAQVTLAGNRTLSVSNIVNGAVYILLVAQDATGGRTLTFPSPTVKFASPGVPALTTSANAVDMFTFVAFNNSLYGVSALNFA